MIVKKSRLQFFITVLRSWKLKAFPISFEFQAFPSFLTGNRLSVSVLARKFFKDFSSTKIIFPFSKIYSFSIRHLFHTFFGDLKFFKKMKTANPPEKSVKRDANFSQFFFNFKKWSFPWFHFKVKSTAVWIVHLPLEIHFLLFMVRVKMADSGQRYANRWNGEGVVKMKTPFTGKPASRQDFLFGHTSVTVPPAS